MLLQLKRQHSAEPPTDSADNSIGTPASGTTPPAERSTTPPKATPSADKSEQPPAPVDSAEGFLGSPLKKQRASVSQADENALRRRIAESSGRINEVLGTSMNDNKPSEGTFGKKLDEAGEPPAQNDEEEL